MDNMGTYKKLIGEDVDEELVKEVESLQKAKMIDVMSPFHFYDDIPESLNYILIELTIYRFNRIGSEGMTSESKTSGNEVYESDYEDKLLKRCVDFVKEQSISTDKRGVKLL